MLRSLKKLAVVGLMTVTSMTGLAATGGSAYAAEAPQVNQVVQVLPFCYGVMDTLGNGGKACVDKLTSFSATYPQTGGYYQVDGHLDVCYLNVCKTTNYSVQKTGAGVDINQFTPRITTGKIRVPVIVSTCVKSTCTPTYVDLPTVAIEILPPSQTPALSACVLGVCTTPLIAAREIGFDSGDLVQLAS